MKPPVWQRLDIAARRTTPFALTLALVLINAVPLHLPGMARVVPVLPLIAVFHWAVYRSDLMPAYAVFFIGILQDILSGSPIGVNACVFLGVYGAVLAQKKFFAGKTFGIVWLAFVLVAAGAFLLTWIFVSILHLAFVAPDAVLFQYLLTVGAFPPVAWVFMRWDRGFLKAA